MNITMNINYTDTISDRTPNETVSSILDESRNGGLLTRMRRVEKNISFYTTNVFLISPFFIMDTFPPVVDTTNPIAFVI